MCFDTWDARSFIPYILVKYNLSYFIKFVMIMKNRGDPLGFNDFPING